MFYVIRAGFSIYKNGLLYGGGQTIELSDLEFERHKHKFENTAASIFPINYVNPNPNNGSSNTNTARIDRRTPQGDFNLSITDANFQHLINSTGATITVFLPPNPFKDLPFSLINNRLSNGNFYCNQTNIQPGDRYEIIFDGVEWVEL